MVSRRILLAAPAALLLVAAVASAQDGAQNTMDIVREALRADKKALVAANLQLTDAEATAFWPVYDRYEKDLLTAHNRLFQVIEEYALHGEQLTDTKALELVQRALAAEEARVRVRSAYVKELSQVLPGRKVARFYQIENKLDASVRYEMAARVPLIKP